MLGFNILTWVVAIALLTAVIPGLAAGIVSRARRWNVERTRNMARWLSVGISIIWWVLAVYALHIRFPYDWIGATMGTPVRVLAFTAWCLSAGYFAPLIAGKLSARGLRSDQGFA